MDKIFIAIFAAGVIGFLLYSLKGFRGRHHRNIGKSKEILKKLRAFNGEYVDGRIVNYLKKINPYVYEEILLTIFEERGYRIERNKRYSGDGGIDGKVFLNGKKYIIQAKRYKNYIKEEHIKEFECCIRAMGADGGFFVHTGKTGKEKMDRYRNGTIEIISGQKLVNFIKNREHGN